MIALPGYQMIRELGRGGMARVYLALHEGLHRQVAIKVMYPNLSGDSSFSERFIREARIVASLNHRNIITVFDVGVHKGHHYIAMEYLPGDRLDDKIQNGLEIKEILSIMKQIAMGLEVAHDKGFIHRDIKPANILFREDGTAVITDFGVARSEESETKMTQTGTIIGTPHYMSPEQAQGFELTASSDIYSLGVIFYEMLTGEVPYRADSTVAVMYKHVNDPVPTLTGQNELFQELLDKLMAKNTAQRYQNAAAIINDIANLEMFLSEPEQATRIMPARNQSEPYISVKTDVITIQTDKLKELFTSRAAVIAGAMILMISASAYFISDYQQHSEEVAETNTKTRYQQLAEQSRLEQIRREQEILERERQEKERLQLLAEKQQREQERLRIAAEEQRLAEQRQRKTAEARRQAEEKQRKSAEQQKLALAQKMRVKKRAEETRQRVDQLIASAESYLRNNNLKDAHVAYRQVLRLDSNNKKARKGLNLVAGKYLGIAERKARETDFRKADYYFNRAKSVSPHHPQLIATKEKIASLKNRQTMTVESKTPDEPKTLEEPKTKQRIFGGF